MRRFPLNFYLKRAKEKGQAIGHFNFATADVLHAIVIGAKEAGAEAVMVGTSEGEADFFGMHEAVALVRTVAADLNFPVYLNADHFRTFEKCKDAIDAGYDSIIIDPKDTHYPDNIEVAKKVVDYARSINADISIEGEMGYLKGASQVQSKIEISPADYTKPDQAKHYIEETGVDRLAVVFGNFHGIATEVVIIGATPTSEGVGAPTQTLGEEHLDISHFKNIVSAKPDVYYVLHGASGVSDQEVVSAIKEGICNVHFNTELRVAYQQAIHKVFHDKPTETTPYKFLEPAMEDVKKLVVHKTKLFLGLVKF